MVAYSFKRRFVGPIKAGTKRQTIRAFGKRRHAHAGDVLHLFEAMRTKHCKLIAQPYCRRRSTVRIAFNFLGGDDIVTIERHSLSSTVCEQITGARKLNAFARRDGFDNWQDFRQFWKVNHPGVEDFTGVLIEW